MAALSPVIAAAEIFLQPDVEADKEIAAAHFFDLQLWNAASPVPPGDRNAFPGKSAHNRLERNLDGQVKMRRNQWLATVDGRFSITFESVGDVVVRHSKH